MLPVCRTEGEGFSIPTFDVVPSDVEGFMDELQAFQSAFHQIPPNLVVGRVRRIPIAPRGQDLQVEHPVRGRHASAFHFHPTQARVLRSPLGRNQVVQVRQPREKRRLAPTRVMKAFHVEELAVDRVMRLIQCRAHRRHLRVFEHRIPARFLLFEPIPYAFTVLLAHCGRDVGGKAA